MGTVSLPIGATNSGTNDWADVYNNDKAIVDQVNGNLVNANLSGSAGITDANLASPQNSVYHTILQGRGFLGVDVAGGTYLLDSTTGGIGTTLPITSGSGQTIANSALPPSGIYFDDADYTVGSKTTKLRLRAQVGTNSAADPAITFTFGLYPVTVNDSTNDQIKFTAGTVVSSSTVAIASPSAGAFTSGVNSNFTIPSDGFYMLGVLTSGQIANNSMVAVYAQLQVVWV